MISAIVDSIAVILLVWKPLFPRVERGSHAVSQGVGLSGAGTGDDEERRLAAVLDRMALFWIEPGEVRRCCHVG
jgi:hypothetical protein